MLNHSRLKQVGFSHGYMKKVKRAPSAKNIFIKLFLNPQNVT